MPQDHRARAFSKPICLNCGSGGWILYKNLSDRLYKSPGVWAIWRCGNEHCQSLWLDPRPSTEDLPALYEAVGYYTHRVSSPHLRLPILGRYDDYLTTGYLSFRYGYGSNVGVWQKAVGLLSALRFNWKAWKDSEVMYLPRKLDGKVFEIGCGNGRVLRELRQLGWNVCGCDFDEKAVESARTRLDIDVKHGTLQEQGYPQDQFDAIVLNHVIEHLPNAREVLAESYRVLKPSGLLRVITPNAAALGHRVFKQYWLHLDPPRHLCIFSKSSLETIVKDAGFEITNVFSSVRDANSMVKKSLEIMRSEQPSAFLDTLNRHRSVVGKMFQTVEWTLRLGRLNSGEELVLMARK